MEVVVGRGTHSSHGIARLRPVVARYLTGKGLQPKTVGGENGEGVLLVTFKDKGS